MKNTLVSCLTLAATAAPAGLAAADDLPPLSIYGAARLDLIVDDSPLSDVQQPFWVRSEPLGTNEVDSELALHPRLSHLGLNLDEWRMDGGMDGSRQARGRLSRRHRDRGAYSSAACGSACASALPIPTNWDP